MRKLLLRVGTAAFITLLGAAPVIGQTRPLAPMPSTGLAVSPFMEGWYQNPDGSRTISFGYLNRNQNDIIYLPIGDRNLLEPAEFSGMQPTVFMPGRHRGVFTVTVPAGFTEDLWWSILNEDGQVHKVPGRTSSTAYELDRNPRPTGTVPPRIGFSENGPWGVDPAGVMADQTLSARVGERVVLEVWVEEISERDPTDPRSEAAKSVRVVWFPHQAPVNGKIEFAKHESTAEAPPPPDDEEGRPAPRPGPNEVMIQSGKGVARVYATFTAPGEYIVRAQADNWRAADSSSGDQCCWSNSYLRVNVR